MFIEGECYVGICYITKWGLGNEIEVEVEVVHLKLNNKNY
jgi:hypothetical protein